MRLFPNPATNVVTVSSNSLASIELQDFSGRLIRTYATTGSAQYDIDISEMPAGVYLISVTDKDGTKFAQRLMKH